MPGADPVGADSGSLLKYLSSHTHLNGAIAQLGERIVRNDEVVGSIPTSSTIFRLSVFTGRDLTLTRLS